MQTPSLPCLKAPVKPISSLIYLVKCHLCIINCMSHPVIPPSSITTLSKGTSLSEYSRARWSPSARTTNISLVKVASVVLHLPGSDFISWYIWNYPQAIWSTLYGLQKAVSFQDEQYQKRVDRSTLSECLRHQDPIQPGREPSGCDMEIIYHWASLWSHSGFRFAPGWTNKSQEDPMHLKIYRCLCNLLKRAWLVASQLWVRLSLPQGWPCVGQEHRSHAVFKFSKLCLRK